MNRSPLFYVAVGVAGVWLYHHFIMPVPGAKKAQLMLVVGLAVTFIGYSVAYYGITQVQGGNWGLFDLMVPGKYSPDVKRDGK